MPKKIYKWDAPIEEKKAHWVAYRKQWLKDHPGKSTAYAMKRRVEKAEQHLFCYIRNKCRHDGTPFNLELSDIVFPEVCPVLGIPIRKATGRHNDNSPSIDKHVPELGYVKGNIQIMSMRANRIKNDGTAEEHEAIANYMRNFSEKQQHPDECISNHHSQPEVC